MKVALITGAGGLVGSEACERYVAAGYSVVALDNDFRKVFFGTDASVAWRLNQLKEKLSESINILSADIRDTNKINSIFAEYGNEIETIIHCAAQPSHDWAAKDPHLDFDVNAKGTLNLLEAFRHHSPRASFIFMSTNKVYGDTPNLLPLVELDSRWEIASDHQFFEKGINESMTIDQSTHSLFGVSKTSADLMVQEYGKYFGLNTVTLRGGCLTGPAHSGAKLHGFLAYLTKCLLTNSAYTVFGYGGKQVRDNIHSFDLISMMLEISTDPKSGLVYNVGGGRVSNCSIIEAIAKLYDITGIRLSYKIAEENRKGDHIWWISDMTKFQSDYPNWTQKYDFSALLADICNGLDKRLAGLE